jgi:hypothetical protein
MLEHRWSKQAKEKEEEEEEVVEEEGEWQETRRRNGVGVVGLETLFLSFHTWTFLLRLGVKGLFGNLFLSPESL